MDGWIRFKIQNTFLREIVLNIVLISTDLYLLHLFFVLEPVVYWCSPAAHISLPCVLYKGATEADKLLVHRVDSS